MRHTPSLLPQTQNQDLTLISLLEQLLQMTDPKGAQPMPPGAMQRT